MQLLAIGKEVSLVELQVRLGLSVGRLWMRLLLSERFIVSVEGGFFKSPQIPFTVEVIVP